MNNFEELEKSRGVILFAFNSDTVDYIKIADLSSRLIEKHLRLPITLITDSDSSPIYNYDKIVRMTPKDGNYRLDKKNNLIKWKNFDRCDVFNLSPYTETLLLDTDYLVLDDSLLKLFEQDFDYRLMYQMQTPEGVSKEEMGPSSLPLVWATVVLFRKTHKSKLFFNLIKRIQQNYSYYRVLYNMRDNNYRNDHAFSIANIILNGYSIDAHTSIPWPMLTIKEDVKSLSMLDSLIVIKNHLTSVVTARQNLHVMDKEYLLSSQFNQFVNEICNE